MCAHIIFDVFKKDFQKFSIRFINFIKENLYDFELKNLDAFIGLFEAKFDMELGSVHEKVLANIKEMDYFFIIIINSLYFLVKFLLNLGISIINSTVNPMLIPKFTHFFGRLFIFPTQTIINFPFLRTL